MKRGTKPKPTTLKIYEGNPGKRPLNHSEPSGGLPLIAPPRSLPEHLHETWAEVVSALPAGIARESDTFTVEGLTRLLWAARNSEKSMNASTWAQIRCFCNELGMTPSSRTGLKLPEENVNPFEALDAMEA